MRRRHPLLLGSVIALAGAAPAAAADVQVKGLDTLAWDKPLVKIDAGDTVTWMFAGTTQAHNVQSGSANWTFRSPLGLPAPDASFTFETPGTYRFVCEVHPSTMVGDVVVGNAPPPPPPPPGETHWPNDSGEPDPLETGGLDTTRPTVRGVRVARRGSGARVTLRVSETSRVTVRLKRGAKTVKTKRASGSGTLRVSIGGKGLRAGRYRVEVRAVDLAGNRSALRTARIRVR